MIEQLEYTSCEDGLDGISGFQVRAASAGLRGPAMTTAMTTAIQDSVYTPSPGLPARPDAEQLAQFPVAFGYSRQPLPVVYRSVYAGVDHSGRWGNYFAHALVLGGDSDLDGALPVDLAESPEWSDRSERVGNLPALARLTPEPGGASPDHTAAFFADAGRRELLAYLLGAARLSLVTGGRRLVLVVADSQEALLWVSAVTRSLPRQLALEVTFTSYTSRPQDHSALLAFTTADVTVPRYGDYQLVDLRSIVAGGSTYGLYDRAAAQLWSQGGPQRLVAPADTVEPPLRPDELDDYARVAVLLDETGVDVDGDERGILDALETARRRAPSLLFGPWDVLAQRVRAAGGPTNLARWGELLQWAVQHQAPVPGPLLRRYVVAVLDTVTRNDALPSLWLPRLEPEQERALAEQIVDRLKGGDRPQAALHLLERPEHARLRIHVVEQLARLIARLPLPDAVHFVAGLPERLVADVPAAALAADVAAAAAGRNDRVAVMCSAPAALPDRPWALRDLARQLWQDDLPRPDEALRLIASLTPRVLAESGLFENFIARLVEDAKHSTLEQGHWTLAERLLPHLELLNNTSTGVIDAVRWHAFFAQGGSSLPKPLGPCRAVARLHGGPQAGVEGPAELAMIRWLLQLPSWHDHLVVLSEVVAGHRPLTGHYLREATALAAEAEPEDVARLTVVWIDLSTYEGEARRLGEELLNEALPEALEGRSKRILDRIGTQLEQQYTQVASAEAQDSWSIARWWTTWRTRYGKTGLLTRLRGVRHDPPRRG